VIPRLLGALLLLTASPSVGRAGEIGFVYVESNVGGASGGHFALRTGERVYGYASSEGLLLLERQDWDDFVFRYGSLENRPIHVAYLELASEPLRDVRDGFAARYLAQRRARAALDDERANAALLEALLGGPSGVSGPGAGLLDPSSRDSAHGRALRRQVERALGASFVSAQIAGIEPSLRAPPGGSGESLTRYRERLLLRAALIALRDAQRLDPSATVRPGGTALGPEERTALESLQAKLARGVLDLLGSSRPDRGQALFLAAARHHAVSRSLEESHWVLLDPLPEGDPLLDEDAVRREREELAALVRHAERLQRAERDRLREGARLDARGYQRMEEHAAQLVEYRTALEEGRPVRRVAPRQPPTRARPLAPLATAAQPADLRTSLRATRRTIARHEAALRGSHGYDLLRRNCVTGIVTTLNLALGGPQQAQATLGAALQFGTGLGFVPFFFFGELRERLPGLRGERIPSYRERRIGELAASGSPMLVRAREATTITSKIYRRRHADGSFVMFTSDAGLARPLYGVVNLGYAAGQAIAGLATAPLDRGRRLERGARGVLFSLPEIIGLSVRKGSFDARAFEPEPAAR